MSDDSTRPGFTAKTPEQIKAFWDRMFKEESLMIQGILVNRDKQIIEAAARKHRLVFSSGALRHYVINTV